mmetsp:Transcript_19989/g.43070  ORF Transcript_19989/g.43070 Transcript_19989/m.43070 type:complete len:289 (+) Transcript_19989:292-1158(+)|eukprot:CAMPEP_0178559096 /NCGR_PEP_ID=MMETSP0697-20121206/10758_1 /TAXON_ID=265572 /ORGANISM="Extubocellulus spinifer, Strain CCMP396" /LENGTH=288 /DNA_ID=CAMNT_0020192237 /DNA_START=212 /DNA_END=1078 /DNA_ORIENTATION=-
MLLQVSFAGGVISKYDSLASSNPNLATSLISLSTYTCAELVRQSFANKRQKQREQSVLTNDGGLSVPVRVGAASGVKEHPSHLRQGVTGVILMGVLGALLHAPWITLWFSVLEGIFPNRTPVDITAKIALDQAVGCPIYYVLLSMATGLAEGHGFRGTAKRIKADMWRAVRLSWMAWPILHCINFAFVPLQRRKLLIQAGGLMWAIFLCKLTAKEDAVMAVEEDQMELLPEQEEKLRLETCSLSPKILAEDNNVPSTSEPIGDTVQDKPMAFKLAPMPFRRKRQLVAS